MNILLAMLVAFLWGTTYAVTQYSLEGWPPLLLGALRALPAGLLLLAIKPNFPERKHWSVLIRLGAINIALFFSLLFVMAHTLPSAISGVGMTSLPAFAMFYYWIFYKKRPSIIQMLSGALLILLAWLLFDPSSITLNPIGLIAMVSAISCVVIGSSVTKALGGKIHWWPVLCWQLIIGGTILTLLASVQALISPAPYVVATTNFSLLNGLGLLWLILLNTVVAYSLYVWLLSRMTVVEFSFGSISNPVAGILMGLMLMNETFNTYQYSLMALMILTSLLSPLISKYYYRHLLASITCALK
jgi:probable blue pigment (indigoidine) exporter